MFSRHPVCRQIIASVSSRTELAAARSGSAGLEVALLWRMISPSKQIGSDAASNTSKMLSFAPKYAVSSLYPRIS